MSARDLLLVLFVMFIWGMHFVVIRIGALEIPPFMLLSIRFALCGLIFLPFAKRISWETFKHLAMYAIPFQGMHMSFLFAGLAQVDASIGGLIMKAELPMLIILGWFVFKERFGPKTFFGLLIAFIGGAIVIYKPHTDANVTTWGIIFLLLSALFWAIGSTQLRRIKDLNFPTMVGYAFTIALPIAMMNSFLFEENHIERLQNADHGKLAIVLFYQVIIVSMSHFGWKVLVGRNPVYVLTAFTILTPIFAFIGGVLILDEPLAWTTILGGAVALAGIAIVTFRQADRHKELKHVKP
ncbi:MAG: EamA family transporter [Alphaproteobacteria bacterium]|nr:EamA family transporter [Alphaproteobacteria bacterium]